MQLVFKGDVRFRSCGNRGQCAVTHDHFFSVRSATHGALSKTAEETSGRDSAWAGRSPARPASCPVLPGLDEEIINAWTVRQIQIHRHSTIDPVHSYWDTFRYGLSRQVSPGWLNWSWSTVILQDLLYNIRDPVCSTTYTPTRANRAHFAFASLKFGRCSSRTCIAMSGAFLKYV